jgi:hypothetical protein
MTAAACSSVIVSGTLTRRAADMPYANKLTVRNVVQRRLRESEAV